MGAFYDYINNLSGSKFSAFNAPQFPSVGNQIMPQQQSMLANYGQDTAGKFMQNPQTENSLLGFLQKTFGGNGKNYEAMDVGIPRIQQAQADTPPPPDDSMKPRSVPQGKYLATQQPLTFAQAIAKTAGWF